MENGIPVGRIFGISIRIHLSWFIIFGLVTWALAYNYFPLTYPGWSTGLTIGISLVTSLLFFLSVLIHEISHSLVAKKYGIPVSSITLFILGGIAEIAEEPKEPKVEFLVAIAGPLSSIIIGIIFGALWLTLPIGAEAVIAVSFWLAWINLMLGVFNLLPGFPMDGGRVLRSLIWWKTDDLDRSTRIASNIGQGVGMLFILGGIFLIFYGLLLNGVWISIIGWFIRSAAASSYRQLTVRQLMKGHTVKEVMSLDCSMVEPDMSVKKLVNDHILPSGKRCFGVTLEGQIKGLVVLADVKKLERSEWEGTRVEQIMTPLDQLKAVGPEEELGEAFKLLTKNNINQLPVIMDGRLEGILARDNLLNFISLKEGLGLN
ncbi:MAG: site-2 protease family protein [Dehalococcoidales bacterium]|nr:site-2 protease family protein [Dehalococcoidales bacterium]MDD3264934.1 site-2 protease family protein [Dehalococcoidales bacterium]MDD4322160.1 site-2 protease family protein [Dehalococcoidales bacterium]MDD4793731.1 site-2 protease family protein [Dehalococcoidales bacterium]MDD5121808.1 site-2 protease family protein [Dehalococcoidales bacterium]